jgi:hypothetical protein
MNQRRRGLFESKIRIFTELARFAGKFVLATFMRDMFPSHPRSAFCPADPNFP